MSESGFFGRGCACCKHARAARGPDVEVRTDRANGRGPRWLPRPVVLSYQGKACAKARCGCSGGGAVPQPLHVTPDRVVPGKCFMDSDCVAAAQHIYVQPSCSRHGTAPFTDDLLAAVWPSGCTSQCRRTCQLPSSPCQPLHLGCPVHLVQQFARRCSLGQAAQGCLQRIPQHLALRLEYKSTAVGSAFCCQAFCCQAPSD